jgi:hypothetical protein
MTRVIRVILTVHATSIELMISHYLSTFGVKTLIKLAFSSVSSPMIGTERPESPERALNRPPTPHPKPSCQKAVGGAGNAAYSAYPPTVTVDRRGRPASGRSEKIGSGREHAWFVEVHHTHADRSQERGARRTQQGHAVATRGVILGIKPYLILWVSFSRSASHGFLPPCAPGMCLLA